MQTGGAKGGGAVDGGGGGGGGLTIGNGPRSATALGVPPPSTASRCSHQELPTTSAGLVSADVLPEMVRPVRF